MDLESRRKLLTIIEKKQVRLYKELEKDNMPADLLDDALKIIGLQENIIEIDSHEIERLQHEGIIGGINV